MYTVMPTAIQAANPTPVYEKRRRRRERLARLPFEDGLDDKPCAEVDRGVHDHVDHPILDRQAPNDADDQKTYLLTHGGYYATTPL